MGYKQNSEPIYAALSCTLIRETEKAWLVDLEGNGQQWIPKSVCIYDPDVDDEIEIEEWFLQKNQLDY